MACIPSSWTISISGPFPGRFSTGCCTCVTPSQTGRAANALAAGLATLTAGSAFKGILEIAGTSSPFESVFFTAGGVLSLAGLLLQIAVSIRRLHRSA